MAKSITDNTESMIRFLNKSIIGTIVYFVLVILITTGLFYLSGATDAKKDIYQSLAVAVIISWIMLVVAYFIWAIYFYNVNRGWTDEDWDDHSETKKITPEMADQAPEKNPNQEETMGLPPGTIRGTIALSMLVAGLAMTIASLSMNSTVPPDSVFIDNFEFFKTAFLMMIAFYFGAKSLEVLDRSRIFSPKGMVAEIHTNTAPAPVAPAAKDVRAISSIDAHLPEDNTDEPIPTALADTDTSVPVFNDVNAKG
ncbi:MAG: hypothetical protein H7259_02285 [Cytophagales bacterium]|nr:hypothetical protein [Cytophaga sp.]